MSKRLLTRVVILLALSAAAGFGEEWNKKFALSGKADLRVDINDGSVTVNGWDKHEIQARVTAEGWRIGLGEVRVADRQNGDRVEIDVRIPRRSWGLSFENRHVHVEVWAPHELRAEVHSGDGRIVAQGIKGDIRLTTNDGRIEADAVDGNLEASTGDGRIRARGRWEQLSLRTGDGSIEAEILSGSKMASSWRLHTGDGHITLRLPDTFAADLDAHTGDGRIRVDLPALVQGSVRSSDFRGKLNGGGSSLVVRTNDGTIRLERL